MSKNRYSTFYAAYNNAVKHGCNLTKEELIDGFTDYRTNSLKDLSDGELRELVLQLNGRTSSPASTGSAEGDKKRDKMRKAIISQFLFVGKTVGDAIAWAEKYGCNGVKRKFNDYTAQELYVLIANAEKMKSDFLKSFKKQ